MNQEHIIYISDITSIERWIKCIAVVIFDVDEGQKVQFVVPSQQLSEQGQKQLAMLAFPDSNSMGQMEGTFQYVFKNSKGLYGYTCFKQKKDSNNPRGYAQKSLVVLSHLPFLTFFQRITELLVYKSFGCNNNQIHQNLAYLCGQIAKWPDPQPISSYILPVLDYEMPIDIPNYKLEYHLSKSQKKNSIQQSPKKQAEFSLQEIFNKQSILRYGLFQQLKLYQTFNENSQIIEAVWMMTITNKSFLIMGDTPFQVSYAVLAAVSIVNPILYTGQIHPYVTVYDPKLNQFESCQKNHILGGTNPLFLKLFNKMEIIHLNKPFKSYKMLNLPKQLGKNYKNEQQKAINQAAIRKYFYRLNQLIIGTIQAWLNLQTNDLKIFNPKDFLKFMKARKDYNGLEIAFQSKKAILEFYQDFFTSLNFEYFLKKRNVIIISS